MTTAFIWMVLIMINGALVTRIEHNTTRIFAGIANILIIVLYFIYILPIRMFDFLPENDFNSLLSIMLGGLVGGLIAWRINPDYFNGRQTPTTEGTMKQQNDPS